MTKVLLALLAALALGSATAKPAPKQIPTCDYTVVNQYPHDPHAFTEGLFFKDGALFESTGLEGQSAIRRVTLDTGAVEREVMIDPELFGEGIAHWNNQIISLTWRSGIGFRWDGSTLRRTGSFRYLGEGWGLTSDGHRLIMSDGTPDLRVIDPRRFRTMSRIHVTADGRSVGNLNELEWVDGQVLANVWMTDRIARIDPQTGYVTAWIDLSVIHDPAIGGENPVLNGIAWDAVRRRLFVTGKNWPALFEIALTGCG